MLTRKEVIEKLKEIFPEMEIEETSGTKNGVLVEGVRCGSYRTGDRGERSAGIFYISNEFEEENLPNLIEGIKRAVEAPSPKITEEFELHICEKSKSPQLDGNPYVLEIGIDDICVVPKARVTQDGEMLGLATCTSELLSFLDVSFEDALENAIKKWDVEMVSMSLDDKKIEDFGKALRESVVSMRDSSSIAGAVCLLNLGVLQAIRNEVGDYYLMCDSNYETFIFPTDVSKDFLSYLRANVIKNLKNREVESFNFGPILFSEWEPTLRKACGGLFNR